MNPDLTLIFRTVDRAAVWLDDSNGTGREEIGLRILKIVEEAGEAASAWIGHIGQNPRKGVTHTREDVLTELADTALTALVAIASLGADPARILALAGR
jgi:NTP pyrophosphatase (non-canonical NTP hydrolase)